MTRMTVMAESPQDSRPPRGIVLTPEEKARQRQRNVAIALALAGLCVLFWIVTLIKGAVVFQRPL